MTKIPTLNEFILSFRKDEEAADRGVVSDEYNCTITRDEGNWYIRIGGKDLPECYHDIQDAYKCAHLEVKYPNP